MRKLKILACSMLLWPTMVVAQKTVATPEPEPETIVENTPAPVEITPEQKINARDDLQKSLQTMVVNAGPKERRQLLDAVNTLEKMRIRRENLNRPQDQQLEYKKTKINFNDRREVQRYLQNTFVEPLDDVFKTPEEETPTATPDKENTEE